MSNTALSFDTLQYAKKLKEVGVPERQAEVQAEAMKHQSDSVQEFIEQNLATKDDLMRMEERLNNRITETNNRIAEMGYKMTIRLGGMLVAGIIVLGVLIKF